MQKNGSDFWYILFRQKLSPLVIYFDCMHTYMYVNIYICNQHAGYIILDKRHAANLHRIAND